MTANNSDTLEFTRILNAPCEIVFKAWTDPEIMKRWWGPNGFTTPVCEIDLRPGGIFHYCMRSPEGRDYYGEGIYREISPPERLAYTDFFVDEKGNPVSAEYYGLSRDWPQQSEIIVTLSEQGDKTKLILRYENVLPTGKDREMCVTGWTETLDRLAKEVDRFGHSLSQR